jgi:type I restriction enzyme S subunit
MIRTTNVRNGFIDTENVRYVIEAVFRKWTRRALPVPGDVVLTREAPLGEVGIIRYPDSVFLGQRTIMYRADRSRLDPYFLMYSMLSEYVQGQIRSYGSGSTVEHMRVPDCFNLLLPLPSLDVQRKISAILSGYDGLIENNNRRIKILEEMARRIYQEWFVDFRYPGHENVPLEDSEVGPIPKRWVVARVGDRLELAYGRALKAGARRHGNVTVFGSGGVIGRHDEALADGPGVIVGRKGNVGSVYWSDGPYFAIDTTYWVRSGLPLTYCYYALRGMKFLDSHAAVPGLSREQAYSLPILVPDREIVGTFDEQVLVLFALRRNLLNAVETLVATRDLLLPRLIAGEVDVTDLDITMPPTAA